MRQMKESQTPAELLPEEQLVSRLAENAVVAQNGMEQLLQSDDGIRRILQELDQEKNWRRIRAVLASVDAYADLLDHEGLCEVLTYVMGMLCHSNGAVRRRAARVGGRLIARRGSTEANIWKQTLHGLLFPSEPITEQQKRWMGYAMQFVLQSLLEQSDGVQRREILNVYVSYFKSTRWDTITCLSLLGGIVNIPMSVWTRQQQNLILQFMHFHLRGDNEEMKLACRWVLAMWEEQGADVPSDQHAEQRDMQQMFVENLQTETPWVRKLMNLQELKRTGCEEPYPYAAHLLNLLRFSNHAVVRIQAGKDLTQAFDLLAGWQRKAALQELYAMIGRAGTDQANEIPAVLGRVFLRLPEEEQAESLEMLMTVFASDEADAVKSAMETAGVILQAEAGSRYSESHREQMIHTLVGMLCRGMTHYDQDVAREAFFLSVYYLFADQQILRERKQCYAEQMARRILVFCGGARTVDDLLYRAAAWKQFGEAVESGEVRIGAQIENRDLILYTDSFDPFTSGHREAVLAAEELGYRVLVNVEKMLPDKADRPGNFYFRRKIAAMSIADVKNAILLPAELTCDLSDPGQLELLEQIAGGRIHLLVAMEAAEAGWNKEPLYLNRIIPVRLPAADLMMTSEYVRNCIRSGKVAEAHMDLQIQHLLAVRGLYTGKEEDLETWLEKRLEPVFRQLKEIRDLYEAETHRSQDLRELIRMLENMC